MSNKIIQSADKVDDSYTFFVWNDCDNCNTSTPNVLSSCVPLGTKVRCFEVLKGDRYSLFGDIRVRANLEEISVWLYYG